LEDVYLRLTGYADERPGLRAEGGAS
jgi:hypothetical protein